jgi:uncharacterized protein YciI
VSSLPPIRREIVVAADPESAFATWTDRIGEWWPIAELSVHGAGGTVAFDDGAIVERSQTGDTATWGSVTEWEPGRLVAFTWHPGRDPERASRVRVSFEPVEAGTLVVLEHDGWEVFAEPDVARTEYGEGWPMVLAGYCSVAEAVAAPAQVTWVALQHRPGPDAPGGSVVADERFAGHVAFLTEVQRRGWLVAAGPFADPGEGDGEGDGEGMTVLRVPGDNRLEEVTRLANEHDAAVTSGLLAVRVRPWQVVMEAGAQRRQAP